jgi:uracil-DNA glycosylase
VDAQFDPAALEELLTLALHDPAVIVSPQRDLFSFGDTKLLSVLDEILAQWLNRAEVALILDELRDRLYAEITPTSIQKLHTALINTVHEGEIQLPHWNIADPDVVFVGSLPYIGADYEQQFIDALIAAGFSSRQCAWTSVTRTVKTQNLDPGRWLPFLFAELRIWRPKLIVTLGAPPLSALLGEMTTVTKARGVIHWVGPWAVLPTYAPAYAVKANRFGDLTDDLLHAHSFAFGSKL